MSNFNYFVTIPCLIWAGIFLLGWSLDKGYKRYKLSRTNRNTNSTKRG